MLSVMLRNAGLLDYRRPFGDVALHALRHRLRGAAAHLHAQLAEPFHHVAFISVLHDSTIIRKMGPTLLTRYHRALSVALLSMCCRYLCSSGTCAVMLKNV